MKNSTTKVIQLIKSNVFYSMVIVPFAITGSLFGIRTTEASRDNIMIYRCIRIIIIGSLLSDDSLNMRYTEKNPKFVLVESFGNFEYA